MDIQPIKNVISQKPPTSIKTFVEAITEIESSLENLRTLILQTDFKNEIERQNVNDNVVYLKQFYERAERISINDTQHHPAANGSLGG